MRSDVIRSKVQFLPCWKQSIVPNMDNTINRDISNHEINRQVDSTYISWKWWRQSELNLRNYGLIKCALRNPGFQHDFCFFFLFFCNTTAVMARGSSWYVC